MAKSIKRHQIESAKRLVRKYFDDAKRHAGDTKKVLDLFEFMTLEVHSETPKCSVTERASYIKDEAKEAGFSNPFITICGDKLDKLEDTFTAFEDEDAPINTRNLAGDWVDVEKLFACKADEWREAGTEVRFTIYEAVLKDTIVVETKARPDSHIYWIEDPARKISSYVTLRKDGSNTGGELGARVTSLLKQSLPKSFLEKRKLQDVLDYLISNYNEIHYTPKKSAPYWSENWSQYKWTGELELCGGYDEIPFMANFLNRVSDPEILLAWIWAFYSEQPIDQMIWLYGPGNTGKSTSVQKLFEELFGANKGLVAVQSTSFKPDTFEVEPLLGAQMAIYADCRNRMLAFSAKFRSFISGGKDQIVVNPKYQKPYSAYFEGGLMVISNELPFLEDRVEMMRRVIVLEVEPFSAENPEQDITKVREGIKGEVGKILHLAGQAYEKLISGSGRLIESDAVKLTKARCVESFDVTSRTYLEQAFDITGEHEDTIEYVKVLSWLDEDCSASPDEKKRIREFLGNFARSKVTANKREVTVLHGIKSIHAVTKVDNSNVLAFDKNAKKQEVK